MTCDSEMLQIFKLLYVQKTLTETPANGFLTACLGSEVLKE